MYRYRYQGNRDVKQDAQLIRAGLPTTVVAGILPGDWVYSVPIARLSQGRSITIKATGPRPIRLTTSGISTTTRERRGRSYESRSPRQHTKAIVLPVAA